MFVGILGGKGAQARDQERPGISFQLSLPLLAELSPSMADLAYSASSPSQGQADTAWQGLWLNHVISINYLARPKA